MATIIWEKELNEPGIVCEMRTDAGVTVYIHNGAYFGVSREEKERRKQKSLQVAQEIVTRAYLRKMEEEKRERERNAHTA